MQMKDLKRFDGKLYVVYVEELVTQINDGGLPKMQDTYTKLCESKSR